MSNTVLGDWINRDNKHYRGHIDRIYVSASEYWEVEYFIDEYLRTRAYQITEENRHAIGKAMLGYPGRAPVSRGALENFLDLALRRK